MKPQTLLLIDDEPHLLRNTADLLELSGYVIYTAKTGKEGVQLALDQKPDLVLCDIMMTGLDGYGVVQIFRNHPDLQHIPFIFLSALAERADLRKGMELGADDYLTKPFGEAELLGAIESRLRMVQQRTRSSGRPTRKQLMGTGKPNHPSTINWVNEKVVRCKKKRIIYVAGDEPARVYFVHEGMIQVFQENEAGKQLMTGLYGPGDFFGYSPLLASLPYQDTAQAVEHSVVGFVSRAEFLDQLYGQSEVTHTFMALMANALVHQEQRMVGLAYHSSRKRIALVLLQYANRFQPEANASVTVKLTREQLARLSGTATESLIRTLSDFHKEGLIDFQAGKVVVSDRSKLDRLNQ